MDGRQLILKTYTITSVSLTFNSESKSLVLDVKHDCDFIYYELVSQDYYMGIIDHTISNGILDDIAGNKKVIPITKNGKYHAKIYCKKDGKNFDKVNSYPIIEINSF
ncbi:MAG: hypothetical protein KKA64_00795 [Nanoarchaeota archaeon]|nr:hypothetical protein [Nanoarchaeota archaeon]